MQNPQFPHSLQRKTNARNVNLKTLYGGQRTLSTQLRKPNYFICCCAQIWLDGIAKLYWCIFVSGSLCGPLSHESPAVVFLNRQHPAFWDLYSTVNVDVVRVKSYKNYLFHPTCVEMGVTINKRHFVPERAVSGVVGVPWDSGGLLPFSMLKRLEDYRWFKCCRKPSIQLEGGFMSPFVPILTVAAEMVQILNRWSTLIHSQRSQQTICCNNFQQFPSLQSLRGNSIFK